MNIYDVIIDLKKLNETGLYICIQEIFNNNNSFIQYIK